MVVAPAQSMRILSWNLLHGQVIPPSGKQDWQQNLISAAKDVAEHFKPDFISLQEVDFMQPRSGNVNQTKLIAESMGLKYWHYLPALLGTPGNSWQKIKSLELEAISQNSKTPIILYNVPGRTISDVQHQTLLRIATECENVVAIKDATGSFSRFSDQQFALRDFPREFKFFTGDDQTTPHFLLSGGNGVVSVVSNIIPREFKEIVELAGNGHLAECMPKYLKYFNLIRLLFVESSPMPVKYVMHKMGFCELEFRLPMCEPSLSLMNEIDAELIKLDLIK
jgi:hypothetical protein